MDSKQSEKLNKLISEVIGLQALTKLTNEKYNEARSKVQEMFDKLNLKSFDAHTAENEYKVNLVERVNITFFADRLKHKISKEKYNEVVEKKYEVSNINRLVKLAKEYGISKEELKECITVKESVNKDKMKQMSALGDIKLGDIAGCYSATISKHIQITEKKKPE